MKRIIVSVVGGIIMFLINFVKALSNNFFIVDILYAVIFGLLTIFAIYWIYPKIIKKSLNFKFSFD